MLKKIGAPSFLIAALCGYLAMVTPDWKSDLHAAAYQLPLDGVYKGSNLKDDQGAQ